MMTDAERTQRRGRAIAMTAAEVDEFLADQRTCRVASVDATGQPHVTPLWFVWDGTHLWLNSLVRSQRWTDLTRDSRVSVVVDAGEGYADLCGVELVGTVDVVGEAPRGTTFDAELTDPELRYARKYQGSDTFTADGRHGWLRVTPRRTLSWDFRKIRRDR